MLKIIQHHLLTHIGPFCFTQVLESNNKKTFPCSDTTQGETKLIMEQHRHPLCSQFIRKKFSPTMTLQCTSDPATHSD